MLHDAVPVSNLDGFGVPDGDVAVRPALADGDGGLLVKDGGGLTPSPGSPCGRTRHSAPPHLPTEQGSPAPRHHGSWLARTQSPVPAGAESGAQLELHV